MKCALTAGRSITKVVDGVTYTFSGQIGLAPEWETSACRTDCQEYVTACVLAHVNTSGQHVSLWLDGDNKALGWGRSTDYPYQEGSFFGNIFVNNPKAYYCNGKDFDIGLVPGRLGVAAGGPYTNPFASGTTYCRDYCTAADSPHGGDGYKSGDGFPHVITVWRNFDPNVDYKVCNRHSGKCLDIDGGSVANGSQLVQNTWTNVANQKWRITQVSPGQYKFMNVKSGKVLDITGGHTANGTPLVQYTDRGSNNQHWSFTPTGTGFYKFSPITNSAASLDVPSFSTADGALIQQYAWNSGTNQQWNIVPAL